MIEIKPGDFVYVRKIKFGKRDNKPYAVKIRGCVNKRIENNVYYVIVDFPQGIWAHRCQLRKIKDQAKAGNLKRGLEYISKKE